MNTDSNTFIYGTLIPLIKNIIRNETTQQSNQTVGLTIQQISNSVNSYFREQNPAMYLNQNYLSQIINLANQASNGTKIEQVTSKEGLILYRLVEESQQLHIPFPRIQQYTPFQSPYSQLPGDNIGIPQYQITNQIPMPPPIINPRISLPPFQNQFPIPQQIPQRIPPQIPQQIPQRIPPQIPPQIPQQIPQQIPPQISQQIPPQIPQQIPPQINLQFNRPVFQQIQINQQLQDNQVRSINITAPNNLSFSPNNSSLYLPSLSQVNQPMPNTIPELHKEIEVLQKRLKELQEERTYLKYCIHLLSNLYLIPGEIQDIQEIMTTFQETIENTGRKASSILNLISPDQNKTPDQY